MELSQRLINLEFKIDLILRKLDEKPDRADIRALSAGKGPEEARRLDEKPDRADAARP